LHRRRRPVRQIRWRFLADAGVGCETGACLLMRCKPSRSRSCPSAHTEASRVCVCAVRVSCDEGRGPLQSAGPNRQQHLRRAGPRRQSKRGRRATCSVDRAARALDCSTAGERARSKGKGDGGAKGIESSPQQEKSGTGRWLPILRREGQSAEPGGPARSMSVRLGQAPSAVS
jgi:hypothetical protein